MQLRLRDDAKRLADQKDEQIECLRREVHDSVMAAHLTPRDAIATGRIVRPRTPAIPPVSSGFPTTWSSRPFQDRRRDAQPGTRRPMPHEDSARSSPVQPLRCADGPEWRSTGAARNGRANQEMNMTNDLDNPHEPGRSMPRSSSKMIFRNGVCRDITGILSRPNRTAGSGAAKCAGLAGLRSQCPGMSTHPRRWKDVLSNPLMVITSSWLPTEANNH